MKAQVVILGCGVSGLSLAWRLAEMGVSVCALEASDTVGGLAGTLRHDGCCMDIGPHSLFSEDAETLRTALGLFDHNLTPEPRRVKFYYQGRFLDYPLTAYSVLFQMGFWSGARALMSFLKSRILRRRKGPDEDETVEDWAIRSFGGHLYRTFFKPYTEQFWKVPCSELSSRSIPTHTRMSFFNTCRALLKRRLGRADSSLVEREMLPTYYPETGFQEIPERIADAARRAGAEVLTGRRAVGVDDPPGGRKRVQYESGGGRGEIECEQVVSTIPVNEFVRMLTPAPPAEVLAAADGLDYRSLIALGMVTEKQDILNCGYVYTLNRPYNRVSEMNEFSPATSPEAENILVVEIPCHAGGPAWGASKEKLFDMCIGSLAEDGFLGPGDVKRLLLIKSPHAYPIYRKDYAPKLKRVLEHIEARAGVWTLGRCGEFMYMDVDKCMRRAFDLAERIAAG